MSFRIFLVVITATTHLTILSYLFSSSFRALHKEPLFLKYILQRFDKTLPANTEEILGWLIPYITGFIFVLCFHLLLQNGIMNLSWEMGLLFGSIVGMLVVAWWHLMFKLSYSIDIDFKRYYKQLFLGYIVFGITVVGVYRFIIEDL